MLTNDEISDIYEQPSRTPREFARSIEAAVLAKLREQNESSHVLWETGEAGVPSAILDRNGEVVLGLCKICGKGECELVDPCKPHPAPIPEGWQPIATAPTDGTRVLIKGDCTVVAGWQECVPGVMGWAIVNDAWMSGDVAKYWTPLPKPPMAAARSE